MYDESCSANSSTSGTVSNRNSSTSGSVSSSNKSTTGTVSNGNNPTSDSPSNSNRSTSGIVSNNSNNYDSSSVSNSNIFSKHSSTSTSIFTSYVHTSNNSTSNISTRNSSINASINTSNSTNGFANNKENRNIDNPSLTLSVECPNDDEFRLGTHEFVNEETCNSNSNNNSDDNTIMKNNSLQSAEEIELFERRFKEGYNIYIDEKYVDWMNRIHPNFLPAHLRKNSSCVSDYNIPQSVSEEVEVCTTSSSEHRSHTEILSYNTDVRSIH